MLGRYQIAGVYALRMGVKLPLQSVALKQNKAFFSLLRQQVAFAHMHLLRKTNSLDHAFTFLEFILKNNFQHFEKQFSILSSYGLQINYKMTSYQAMQAHSPLQSN